MSLFDRVQPAASDQLGRAEENEQTTNLKSDSSVTPQNGSHNDAEYEWRLQHCRSYMMNHPVPRGVIWSDEDLGDFSAWEHECLKYLVWQHLRDADIMAFMQPPEHYRESLLEGIAYQRERKLTPEDLHRFLNEHDELVFDFELSDEPPPPPDWLVEGLIPCGSVGFWFGHAESNKTWLLLDIARAVAQGEPWLGRKVKPGLRVGLVDYETGSDISVRLYRLGAGKLESLGVISYPKLKANNPRFWEVLKKRGFDLVIIDSLFACNPEANELTTNETADPLLKAGSFAHETGCAVVFIHHATKGTDGGGWPTYRGASVLLDQVDWAYAIRVAEKGVEKQVIDVRCDKAGKMPRPSQFRVEFHFDDPAVGEKPRKGSVVLLSSNAATPHTRAARPVETPEERQTRILTTLRPLGRKGYRRGTKRLAEELGLTRQTLDNDLKELQAAKKVDTEKEDGKSCWFAL